MNESISTFGFITRNRVPALARAVESYIQNTLAYGRKAEFVVMDDSETASDRAACKQMLQTLKDRYGVVISYAGLEEKTRYIEDLIQESGFPKDVVEFALLNPEGCGCSMGANRNTLLLHTVSERFFCADDDTVCRMGQPPRPQTGLKITSVPNPLELFAFPDHQTTSQSVHVVEEDILAMHERVLGKNIDTCLDLYEDNEIDAKEVSPRLAQKLLSDKGRVRITWMGIFGDSGVDYPGHLLSLRGRTRDTVMASDVTYRAICRSRQILRIPPGLTIGGEGGHFQSTALGIDNQTLLPPYTPVCRGEDGLFGLLFMKCFDDYIAYLPRAIFHDPQPVRTNRPEDITRGGSIVYFHAMLKQCVLGFERPQEDLPESMRLRALGRYLITLASGPRDDFEKRIHSGLVTANQKNIKSLRAILQASHGTPRYWAADLKACVKNLQLAPEKLDYLVPVDLFDGRTADEARRLAQHLVLRFGQVLTLWPDLMEAAKCLRSKNVRVAQPIGSKL